MFNAHLAIIALTVVFLSVFPVSSTAAKQKDNLQVPISSWGVGGQPLIPDEQLVPFIERQILFERLLNEPKEVVFIDIREPDEFAKSHLPHAWNIPFSEREEQFRQLDSKSSTLFVPYCNWDFRAYVAGLELKQQGFNVGMMYPHGLRGWIAAGLPVAGNDASLTDEAAWRKLAEQLQKPTETQKATQPAILPSGKSIHVVLHVLPKQIEPAHIEASVGDQLMLDLIAEEEEHWVVFPDFGVNLKLKPGEKQTITLQITRSGYFPFGCISCCTQYRCQTKQAILVDLDKSTAAYGE